jgi:hypothetical protein
MEPDRPFRTQALAAAVLQQRLADQENLRALPFEPETVQLLEAKLAQMRTYADPAGIVVAQEIRFRHERIRDYFTHFAFLDLDAETRAKHAQDTRLAGVFPYLARALRAEDALELRERLIRLAAEIEDHRVSDSFVRELSWRQRMAARDPDWMLGYDLPAARTAEADQAQLAQERQRLDAELSRLGNRLAAARRITRILVTADHERLLALACELLTAVGAQPCRMPPPNFGIALADPSGAPFLLVAISQSGTIRPFHLELLLARLGRPELPALLVTNSQVALPPDRREPDLAEAMAADLTRRGLLPLGASTLYAWHLSGDVSGPQRIWEALRAHVPAEWAA